jgi:hypothetical protein
VEKELERAHEAINAGDADAAERGLARTTALLREHPELLQAAWLRAEAERTWSARWLRIAPRDEARARAAWENAAALDGGRVAGIGETNFPPPPKVKATIVAIGTAEAALYLDGTRVEPTSRDETSATYTADVAPGEHHLLALRGGRTVFASWVALAGAEPTARLSLGDGGACSRELFRNVRREDSGVSAPGALSPAWVAAVPGARRGSILVARCERDTCGPLLEWRIESSAAGLRGPPQPPVSSTTWPAWATWTLVGIGAATAASVALVATGVFETRPVETRFVVGGTRQE